MTNTDPIAYLYNFLGHAIRVTREHVGTAYARNGNVGNPTEYFVWNATLNGQRVAVVCSSRAVAYEYARAAALGIRYRHDEGMARRSENVRGWVEVQREMKRNYIGRQTDNA